MAWNEKAVEAALAAAKRKFVYYSQVARSDELVSAVSSALDAAAAVDGDAQWNAAIEAAAKIAEDGGKYRDWVPGSLYETLRRECAAAIRSLKRLK
jgi:hypothetical protein